MTNLPNMHPYFIASWLNFYPESYIFFFLIEKLYLIVVAYLADRVVLTLSKTGRCQHLEIKIIPLGSVI